MKKNKKRNSLTTALAVYEECKQKEEMTHKAYNAATAARFAAERAAAQALEHTILAHSAVLGDSGW